MTDSPGGRLLARSRSVLLVDWPSRDVPNALARAGLTVVAQEGDDAYYAYLPDGEMVTRSPLESAPAAVDLVYAHRPVAELAGIVELARGLGARGVWMQSGRTRDGTRDPRSCWLEVDEQGRAREIVERAGLEFVSEPYIGDLARSMSIAD